MAMNRFAYGSATSLAEAIQALDEQCRPLAGGTDLLAMIKEELVRPEKLLNIKGIADMAGMQKQADGLHLGALTRLSDLLRHPAVNSQPAWACLYQAVLQTASPQLRHMATLGGNLMQRPRCWYFRSKLTRCLRKGGERCFAFRGENKYHAILGGGPCYIVHPSDPAVALLALEAAAVVVGPHGARTVPLHDLYLLPRQDPHRETDMAADELIAEVVLPTPSEGARGTYIKAAERQAWDFALVSVAVQVAFDRDKDGAEPSSKVAQARLALGGVAPVPWLAEQAAQVLVGQALSAKVIDEAARVAVDGARALEQNAYKIDLAQGLVRQALEELRP